VVDTASGCTREGSAHTRHEEALQLTCKPNSVPPSSIPFGTKAGGDDHSSSPGIADGIQQPTRKPQAGRLIPPGPSAREPPAPRGAPLFGLAPCGVLPATTVTSRAVRSYRTFSPLPASALGPSSLELLRGKPVTSEACSTWRGTPVQNRTCLAVARRREAPRAKAGGIFSVPLSVGLPRPGITRHTALRSSDFPLRRALPSRHMGGRAGL
jgi:hypothetical protein